MKLLCFDVGASTIKYAVIDEELTMTHRGKVPTPMDSYDRFSSVIVDTYHEFADEVEGVAIAMPGFIDAENGMYSGSGVFRYRHERNQAEILTKLCGCTVRIENDGKAAALAEFYHGSLKGCRNAAVFIIGTGVGGGLIIDGKLVRGPHNTAGEFSFVNTNANDYTNPDKTLGNSCSTAHMLDNYRRLSPAEEYISGHQFFDRLESDAIAKVSLNDLCRNVAIQLYNLCWILDLEKVAIGGGISQRPIVTETIRKKFWEVSQNSFAGKINLKLSTEIVTARFCNDANLVGAYLSYKTHQ